MSLSLRQQISAARAGDVRPDFAVEAGPLNQGIFLLKYLMQTRAVGQVHGPLCLGLSDASC